MQRKIVPLSVQVRGKQHHSPAILTPFEQCRGAIGKPRQYLPAAALHSPRPLEPNLAEVGRQSTKRSEDRMPHISRRECNVLARTARSRVERRPPIEDAGENGRVDFRACGNDEPSS